MVSAIAPDIAACAIIAGATKVGIRHRLAVQREDADQRPDADADAKQVEHRLEEAGEIFQPVRPEHRDVALDRATGPAGPRPRAGVRGDHASPSSESRRRTPAAPASTEHGPHQQVSHVRDGRATGEAREGGHRHSSTACHSGDAYASGRSQVRQLHTGKNTPANSVNGITTNRNSSEK